MGILYYETQSGRAPVEEFISELPLESRYEVLTLLRRLELGEYLGMPHSRSLASMASGLHELRLRDSHGHIRIFYYTRLKGKIYLVHALRKKSQTISEQDKRLILSRLRTVERIC